MDNENMDKNFLENISEDNLKENSKNISDNVFQEQYSTLDADTDNFGVNKALNKSDSVLFIAENYLPENKKKKGRVSLVLACLGLFLSFFNFGLIFALISFVTSLIGFVIDKKSTTFKWAFYISIAGIIFSTLFLCGYLYFSSKGNPFPD